jgi:hypothetical protein
MSVARPEKRAYSREVSDRTRRLYLSGEEIALGGGAKRLISVVQRAGVEMFWSQIRTGGLQVIGHEINASNGVLALVNANWATSTYHSAEISFALGEKSYNGQPALKTPCPVMAFIEEPESRFVRDHWMQSRIEAGQVIVLPSEPEHAAASIRTVLTAVA